MNYSFVININGSGVKNIVKDDIEEIIYFDRNYPLQDSIINNL